MIITKEPQIPNVNQEVCWNCEAVVTKGPVHFSCVCGCRWLALRNDMTDEEIQRYYDSRGKQVENITGLPLYDFTQPGYVPGHP